MHFSIRSRAYQVLVDTALCLWYFTQIRVARLIIWSNIIGRVNSVPTGSKTFIADILKFPLFQLLALSHPSNTLQHELIWLLGKITLLRGDTFDSYNVTIPYFLDLFDNCYESGTVSSVLWRCVDSIPPLCVGDWGIGWFVFDWLRVNNVDHTFAVCTKYHVP